MQTFRSNVVMLVVGIGLGVAAMGFWSGRGVEQNAAAQGKTAKQEPVPWFAISAWGGKDMGTGAYVIDGTTGEVWLYSSLSDKWIAIPRVPKK